MASYNIDKITYGSDTYNIQDNISGYTSNVGTITEVDINGTPVSVLGDATLTIAQLSDIIYPVGCYYETSNSSFDPNVSWGGTWYKEIAGQVHTSAGSSYTISGTDTTSTEGSETKVGTNRGGATSISYTPSFSIANTTITTSTIQSHTHGSAGKTFYLNGRQRGANSGMAVSELSAIVHEMSNMTDGQNYGGSSISYLQCGSVSQTGYCDVITLNLAHEHPSQGGGQGHTHGFTGKAQTVSTMQPYVVVNRWHKIGPAMV